MNAKDIKVLFDTHPTTNEFFITTDDQAFFAENMADAHGQKLKDRTVKKLTRDGIISEIVEATEPDEAIVTAKSLLEIAQETPEAERTGYQKGLITKEAKRIAASEGGNN